MSPTTSRLRAPLCVLAIGALAISTCFLLFKTVDEGMHRGLAVSHIRIFGSMREEALATSDPSKAVGFLQYAVEYYPSGSRQEKGSGFDEIVERHRSAIVREIIADLRTKTGRDLGSEPTAWINAFMLP